MHALRDDMELVGRILDEYRPELVADASARGKSIHSARTRVCNAIEDQQIQFLEESFASEGVEVGDVVYDAILVRRCPEEVVQGAIYRAEVAIRDRLGIDAKFKAEPWPAVDDPAQRPDDELWDLGADDCDSQLGIVALSRYDTYMDQGEVLKRFDHHLSVPHLAWQTCFRLRRRFASALQLATRRSEK